MATTGWFRGALIAGGLLVLGSAAVACGSADRSSLSDGPGSSTTSTPTGARLLSCGGGLPFSPSALQGPVLAADDADPAVVALRAGEMRVPGQTGEFRLLARTEDEATFAETVAVGPGPLPPTDQGDKSSDVMVWTVAKANGVWKMTGGGTCNLAAVIDGLRADPWELDTAAPPPGPESRDIAVLVHVRSCASGRTSEGRIRPPQIVYGATAVEIAITTTPPEGGQTCPSSPPTPFVVRLREPLGQRRLLDSGREPIAAPTTPRP